MTPRNSGMLTCNAISNIQFTAQAPLSPANADDPRCNAPPYGGTVAGYKAFVGLTMQLGLPAVHFMSGVCKAKLGGDRTGFYNLGITDAEIDGQSMDDFWITVLRAVNKWVDTAPEFREFRR